MLPLKNILIKTRKSTSPFTNTLSDPMNSLQNTYLKEKRINMIMNFLVLNNYPNNFNKKEFIAFKEEFEMLYKPSNTKLDKLLKKGTLKAYSSNNFIIMFELKEDVDNFNNDDLINSKKVITIRTTQIINDNIYDKYEYKIILIVPNN